MEWSDASRTLDQRQREEYEERKRKRDAERQEQRKEELDARTMGAKQRREQADRERVASAAAGAGGDLALEDQRTRARQAYLEKREGQMKDYLKYQRQMDEVDSKTMPLTQREQRDIEYRKMVEGELKHHQASVRDIEDGAYYSVPSSAHDLQAKAKEKEQRADVLFRRYSKVGEEEDAVNSYAEQRNLEAKKIREVGVLKKRKKKEEEEERQLLVEDQIEFIAEKVLLGEMSAPILTEKELKAAEEQAKKRRVMEIQEVRKMLPIYELRDQLISAIRDHQVLIMVGETGSGKTTQLAQYLYEAGFCGAGKKVGCTQPRRVAAMSVAARVAQEMNVKLGNEVGYAIRFEDITNEKTRLKYMTDGMLLREFLSCPDLEDYSVMIVDEAHERSLHTDILFGLIKDVCRFRTKKNEEQGELKLIISSATLESQKFSEFFDGAPVFHIPGRMHDVEIFYTKAPEANYIEAAALCALQTHIKQPLPGDILIFLCGQDEIEECYEDLLHKTQGLGTKIGEVVLHPIYSTLPTDKQAKIFEPTPPEARKIVIATNIAETSLTIDGIVYVIDCGYCKQKSYNPRSSMEALQVVPISKAQAQQRAGRAGRTRPGICFRLYTANSFRNELDDAQIPEIQRTNLGNVVLMLKSIGVHELLKFDFLDAPPPDTLIRALEQLFALGALNDKGQLTKMGRMMAEFPLDPQLSKTLCVSQNYKCSDQIVTVCSMLSVGNSIFHVPREKRRLAQSTLRSFYKGGGDHLALCNVFEEWADAEYSEAWCHENYVQIRSMRRARDIRDQMCMLCERAEVWPLQRDGGNEDVLKCIAAGFFCHTAKRNRDGKSFKTVKNPQEVWIHPGSYLAPRHEKDEQYSPPKWVIYHELVLTSKEYMRQVIEIQPQWLVEIAPHYYRPGELEDESATATRKKQLPRAVGKSTHDPSKQGV
eukprot:Hpha_TRINITY_DN15227_c1_g8::TRINITY_DN15227_c1_g8_i2::g.65300::m.65300/K12813/DHX16; pre-mRNA-splicing factor ATP-dependent RNA helicase DHX16